MSVTGSLLRWEILRFGSAADEFGLCAVNRFGGDSALGDRNLDLSDRC